MSLFFSRSSFSRRKVKKSLLNSLSSILKDDDICILNKVSCTRTNYFNENWFKHFKINSFFINYIFFYVEGGSTIGTIAGKFWCNLCRTKVNFYLFVVACRFVYWFCYNFYAPMCRIYHTEYHHDFSLQVCNRFYRGN